MEEANYVAWLRKKVGHDPVILNAAVAIIVNDAGEVLFMRRGDFTAEAMWGLPGGMMEITESAEETMRREVKEETGLTVSAKEFLGGYTNNDIVSYPNGDTCKVIVFVFICAAPKEVPEADGKESLELKYFKPGAPPKLFRPYIANMLKDFASGKRGVIR